VQVQLVLNWPPNQRKAHQVHQYGLNRIDPKRVKISLIEAADHILPALSEKIPQHTLGGLHHANFQVLIHKRVSKIDEKQIYFAHGASIPADLKVWCAGIQAPKVFQQLMEFEKDHLNRLKVYATLQTRTDPNIFAFGDCAHCQPIVDEPVLGPRAQWPVNKHISWSVQCPHELKTKHNRCLNLQIRPP
jgi:NADH dehydrogenase